MSRPVSIVRFEQLWWASTLVWLIGTVLGWARTQYVLAANPQTAVAAPWIQSASVALVLLVTVVLWFFVARRSSVVAKWAVVILAAVGVLRARVVVFTLMTVRHPQPFSSGIALVAAALSAAAAVMLFREDALRWFGEEPAAETDSLE